MVFDRSHGGIYRYHESMLADTRRVRGFRSAIRATVRPGDVVVDLGCGSGILALLALEAGASHVHAIDDGPVAHIATDMFRSNGVADRVTLHNRWSTEVELDTRADVLVTETIGNLAYEEGILGSVIDAQERLLTPEARIVPGSLSFVVVAAEHPAVTAASEVWSDDLWGFAGNAIAAAAAGAPHWARLQREHLRSTAMQAMQVDLATNQRTALDGEVTLRAVADGAINCLSGWFTSTLAPGVEMHNQPGVERDNWYHGLLPLSSPLMVVEGEELAVRLAFANNGALWNWSAEARSGVATGSSFTSELIRPRAVKRRRATRTPERTQTTDVAQFVLERIDGAATIGQLAESTRAAFPSRYPTAADAMNEVADLAARFG